ncbi:MAG: FAD binding domain-containing protein, partial [Giesbergeria sp.]
MRSLHFLRRGQPISLANVPPDRTLLDLLRDDLGATGTKEGCGEGDCGACTVVLGEIEGTGANERIRYRAINACIRLAHSIEGMALWTVEDLAQDPLIESVAATAPTGLHPAQESMVQCHGSQCGFCTPGFVMSLFAMYQNRCCQGEAISRADAVHDLSGNLCRCTGYRPILDAAQAMGDLPVRAVNETKLLQQLKLLALDSKALEPDLTYISPTTEAALLAARAAHPQAQVVAGCTDVGLWVTKQHRQFAQVLDVTTAAELRTVSQDAARLTIGAAVNLADAYGALQQHWPQLDRFAARFAGLPIRNSGTLGGNVANGSPIGDSMPLLIALRARVELGSVRGTRELALEDLYTGYRKNVM